jgi:methionyl-tRNA formyltransferase
MIYKRQKVVFIGNLIFSKELLKTVLTNKKFEVVGIISKNKSSYNSDQHSLRSISKREKIKYFNFTKDRKKKMKFFIKKLKPDYIFCFGWSHILNSDILKIPLKKSLGYHPTLLPRNKGRHPIIWTIILGLKKTGSTFFAMDMKKEVDSGQILSQKNLKVNNSETSTTLYKKLILTAKKQLKYLLDNMEDKKFYKKRANGLFNNYWRKRTFEDGIIDWRSGYKSIIRLVNALKKPYQNASIRYKSKFIQVKDCKLLKYNLINYHNIEPGKILNINKKKNFIDVKCYDKVLRLTITKPIKDKFTRGNYL